MQEKDPISSFRNCPRCASPMVLTDYDHRTRKVCPDCGYVDYHNPAPAAGAVVVKDGKLLLVKRAAEPYRGDWCIPAGFMEWDESPRHCAERELKEETGLDIVAGRVFEVYSGTDDPRTNAVLILYFCEISGGAPEAGDDAAELGFFGVAEIPPNIAFLAHRQAIADLLREFPGLLK
jgi:8-oxo-dGTP diphosphatase